MSGELKAVILAAGEGTRLRPYTDLFPKPLFLVNGITLLTYHLDRLKKLGISEKDTCVVVRHLKDEVVGFLKRYHPRVNYVVQKEDRYGTAVAALSARDFVGKNWSMIIYGDTLFEDPLSSWICGEEPLIGLKWAQDVSPFGKVLSRDGYLVDLIEKGETGEGYVFAGIVKEPPEFYDILDKIQPNERTKEYYLTDAIKVQNRRTPHRVYNLKGYWTDIGHKDSVVEARSHFFQSFYSN